MPSSSVSSSITRAGVIFVFASLFPTLFLLIVVVFVINYGLEYFANLGTAFIYHSAHQLFEYKLVLLLLLVFFFLVIGGLNIHWCFTHEVNFHIFTLWLVPTNFQVLSRKYPISFKLVRKELPIPINFPSFFPSIY